MSSIGSSSAADTLAAVILAHLGKDDRFFTQRDQFRTARPFPHIALDNVLPSDVLSSVDAEFPEDVNPRDCKRLGRRLGWHCTMQPNHAGGFLKLGVTIEAMMGNASQALLKAFKHPEFIRRVEALTGIGPLAADPHNVGSGLHQILPNGSLQLHADNNHGLDVAKYARLPKEHPLHAGLAERRVNLFLYFNEDWRSSEWGGDLELWPRDLHACEARIAPLRNRLVLFASTDFSYHGHPQPLACPIGRSRRSLAVYYYTSGRRRPADEVDAAERRTGTTTIYKRASGECAL